MRPRTHYFPPRGWLATNRKPESGRVRERGKCSGSLEAGAPVNDIDEPPSSRPVARPARATTCKLLSSTGGVAATAEICVQFFVIVGGLGGLNVGDWPSFRPARQRATNRDSMQLVMLVTHKRRASFRCVILSRGPLRAASSRLASPHVKPRLRGLFHTQAAALAGAELQRRAGRQSGAS